MKIPESLSQYEDAATLAEMRRLIDGTKRLERLASNSLVAEYVALRSDIDALRLELDNRPAVLARAREVGNAEAK